MKRNVWVFAAVLVLGLVAIWFAAGRPTPVSAQSDGGALESSAEVPDETADGQTDGGDWGSSAELPDGTADEQAPPSGAAEEEMIEGGSLVSWRVTGSALQPRENNVTYSVDTNGSCVYVTAGSSITVWNTPVHLPNGSVIDTLRMYYYDTSASNTTGWFTVYDLYGAIVDEWSVSSNTSAGNSFSDSAQINHTIDYSIYSYLINWRPLATGSTLQLCGFRVFYTPPPFGLGFFPAIFNP
jgi:hypothetical protein